MLTKADLAGFSGSDNYYKHWTKRLVYTDGVNFLAKKANAFWLIDVIASYQNDKKITGNKMLKEMQFWKLIVNNNKGILTCIADTGEKPAILQNIEFTDFPLESIDVWVESGSIDGVNSIMIAMLPNER